MDEIDNFIKKITNESKKGDTHTTKVGDIITFGLFCAKDPFIGSVKTWLDDAGLLLFLTRSHIWII